MSKIKSNLNDIVEVTCYNTTKRYTRKEALAHFLECMMCSEGSEQSRYTRIYCALSAGFLKVTDEEV